MSSPLCGRVTTKGTLCRCPRGSCRAKHHAYALEIRDVAYYAVFFEAIATYKIDQDGGDVCDSAVAELLWTLTDRNHFLQNDEFLLRVMCHQYDVVEVPLHIRIQATSTSSYRRAFPRWSLVQVQPVYVRRQNKEEDPGNNTFDVLQSCAHCFRVPAPKFQSTHSSTGKKKNVPAIQPLET